MSTRNDLPSEIIELIVHRLPPKSLGRFKCVSKPWLSLISNPQFIKTHLFNINNHHHHNKLILISDSSLYSLDINQLPGDISATGKRLSFRPSSIPWEEILGSCNGVVLAQDEDHKIYLINPTTLELWEIPVSPFALPFAESFVLYGFGYDSSTDDYNVISISPCNPVNKDYRYCQEDMFVSIYSLRCNSWRKLQSSPYRHFDCYPTSGVLLNENLHWLARTRREYTPTLVAFSLAKQEFKEMELPADPIDGGKFAFNMLDVGGGKLVVLGNWMSNDMWVMEEYGVGGSWTKVSNSKPRCWYEDNDGDDCELGEQIVSEGTYAETLESLNRFQTTCQRGKSGFGFSKLKVYGLFV